MISCIRIIPGSTLEVVLSVEYLSGNIVVPDRALVSSVADASVAAPVNGSVVIVTNSVPVVGTDVVLVVVHKVVGGSGVATCFCASIVLTRDFLAGRLFDVFLEPHGYIRFN